MIREEYRNFTPDCGRWQQPGFNHYPHLMGRISSGPESFRCLPSYNQASRMGYEAGYEAGMAQFYQQMQMQHREMQFGGGMPQFYPYQPPQGNMEPYTGIDNCYQDCMPQGDQSLAFLQRMGSRTQQLEAERMRQLEARLERMQTEPPPQEEEAEAPVRHAKKPHAGPSHSAPATPSKPIPEESDDAAPAKPTPDKTAADKTAPTTAAKPKAEVAPPKTAAEIRNEKIDKLRQDLMQSGDSLDSDQIKLRVVQAGLTEQDAQGLITCLKDGRWHCGNFSSNQPQKDMLDVWCGAAKSNGDMKKFAASLLDYSNRGSLQGTNMSEDTYAALVQVAGNPPDAGGLKEALRHEYYSGWGGGGMNFNKDGPRNLLRLRM